MKETKNEHSLCLTEEEALGLLNIVMLSPGDLTAEQRAAVLKLGEFCREMIREASAVGGLTPSIHTSRSSTFAA